MKENTFLSSFGNTFLPSSILLLVKFKGNLRLETHKNAYEYQAREETSKFLKFFLIWITFILADIFFVTRYYISLVDLVFMSPIVVCLDVIIRFLLIYKIGFIFAK